ncbi:MAG: dTDP-4-dehydrorhamnose reductase [Bacteroidetes bacterium]|nr:dTDP-4-dehydrorhamnose reductase [Bacteroidota bacterium]
MKYIIFGSEGQLGRAINNILVQKEVEIFRYDLPDYDISNFLLISKIINDQKPDIIINCAAFNEVDAAEKDYEIAYKTNVVGVENLAVICKRENVKLVHFSTDYVFDGKRYIPGLYTEDDIPSPINNYGKTKLEGEELINKHLDNALILRTSWLYGDGTNNFLFKLNQWSKENKILKIVNDEFSVPTSTHIVAKTTLQAINNNLAGLFNLTCTGYCSRYDFAKTYFNETNKEQIIYPCSNNEIFTFTKRPSFSALSNAKICNALQINLPNWKEELISYLRKEDKKQPNIVKLHIEL